MGSSVFGMGTMAGAVLLGVVSGMLYRKHLFPKVLAKVHAHSAPLARMATSRNAVVGNILLAVGYFLLALACRGPLAPTLLAWIRLYPVMPYNDAPAVVSALSLLATFFGGYTLGAIPRGDMEQSLPSNLPGTPRAPIPASATPPPVNKHSSTKVVLVISCTLMVGFGLGALQIGLKKGGFLTTSDVGGLAELAQVQELLMPLDACEIHYQRRDRRGHRNYPTSVYITACSRGSYNTTLITVPGTWARSGVGFEMSRGSPSERWKIMVEKDEVPFPELQAALTHFAPIIAAQYPEELRETRERMDAFDKGMRDRQQEDAARKERAKTSYPE